MSEPNNAFEKYEDIEIKPTSDLFIGVFLSNPNNEWILVHLLNAVLLDSGWSPVVEAKVLNPISLQDYSVEQRVVLDVRVRTGFTISKCRQMTIQHSSRGYYSAGRKHTPVRRHAAVNTAN